MKSKIRAGLVWLSTRAHASAGLGVVGLAIMLTWHLGSLPGRPSPAEAASLSTSNLKALEQNPLNAPYRLIQDVLVHINHSLFFSRLAGVVVALIFAVSFYYLLKGWFGKPIAMLSTVLLVFTPYFILSARSATTAIMYFIPALLLAAYSVAVRRPGDRLPLILLVLSAALALYVPGIIWLLTPMVIYRFSRLKDMAFHAELDKRYYSLIGVILLLAIVPLAISFVSHPAVLKSWLLIPASFPALPEIAKSWLEGLSSFFLQSPAHQNLTIGQLPLLDAAQVGLLVFGGYVMWSRLRLELVIIVGFCLLIALLSGLNHNYAILAMGLPLLVIMIGMGLRYLFIEWRYVFPFNPIAKAFAIGLMSVLVLTHVLFGIRYSLVAWPATVASAYSYVLK